MKNFSVFYRTRTTVIPTSFENKVFEFERLERSSSQGSLQRHPIQPKHAGGADAEWNTIYLSAIEHAEAHNLLFECYNNHYDYCAWAMMTGQTEVGLRAMREQNQRNMKKNQKGFYDPNLQRDLGKRPKRRRPYARNPYILAALKRGFILESLQTGSQVIIQPNECSSLVDVVDKWMEHPEMSDDHQSWLDYARKNRFSFLTALTRMLTGHVDPKTKKALFTVKGWRVLGLLLKDGLS